MVARRDVSILGQRLEASMAAETLQCTSRRSDTAHGGKQHVERKTISIMKACELVGVSRRTIYNWLASHKIEYVRTAGGSVRIFVDTLWRDPHRADQPAVQAMWRPEPRDQA
jgi:excisionase family DNA binding protein